MDIQHFKQKYIEEARDLINNLENDLINLEKDSENIETVEKVFRVMHTLKGSGSMYGFNHISYLTHHLETIFNLVCDKQLKVNSEIVNLTLASIDHIRNLLQDEALSEENNKAVQNLLFTKIEKILENPGLSFYKPIKKEINTSGAKIRTWHILFTPNEEIISRSINILYTLQDLFQLGAYRIEMPNEDTQIEYWSIFLVTDKPKEEIEDTLIFVSDYFQVRLVGEFDIFDEKQLIERQKYISDIENKLTDHVTKNAQLKEELIKHEVKAGKFIPVSTTRVYVNASKLDTLMFLVSELVTAKSELLLSIQNKSEENTSETALKIDKLAKLFRDNALDIRLISLNEMTMQFNRLVRDLAIQLGKRVVFEIHGGDTELDKNIIDNLSEPLMHLIRNCIDHGIETPDERADKNKPETGIIRFNAYKQGNSVFIQISDDGNGIDKTKVLQKAVLKGIMPENANLTDKEIFDLIFLPGFSTAESLTQVSGRGVGMDIVRKKIQEIRGEIYIDSETGKGTTFTLKLQQSISIIDTLLIKSEYSKFAIPLEDIESCLLTNTAELINYRNKQISYKDELVPYISLNEEFNVSSNLPETQKIIVINKQNKRFAIITDEIIGEYQAVVKPLGNTFIQQEFISGASILGDGSIALLLETEKLKKLLLK